MIAVLRQMTSALRRFRSKEDGLGSIEFVIGLPVFMFLFTLAFEVGIINTRQVMLDHALDRTVREVRIGLIVEPTHEQLIDRMCDYATIIHDCQNQLRLEMSSQDVRNIDQDIIVGNYTCRDRSEDASASMLEFTNTGENNELMVLRVCALFDPLLWHMGLGRRIADEFEGGAYALVGTATYVMEPYQ